MGPSFTQQKKLKDKEVDFKRPKFKFPPTLLLLSCSVIVRVSTESPSMVFCFLFFLSGNFGSSASEIHFAKANSQLFINRFFQV